MTSPEYPPEANTWSRGRRSEWLRGIGMEPDTADWNRSHSELAAMAASYATEMAAAEAERERRRIEPYLAEARENVAAWGCVEDGEPSPEEIEEMVREEAARMAEEAEEAADEAASAAEREAEEAADYDLRQAAIKAAVAAATDAAAAAGWRAETRRCSHDCSRYFWLLRGGDPGVAGDYDEAVSLRISDHHAKNGSGWNESKQEQYPEPDINIVIRRGAGGEYTFDLTPLVETIGR
jgi:hypothetical protein